MEGANGSSLPERLAWPLLFVESEIGGAGCAAKTADDGARVRRLRRADRLHRRLALLVVAARTHLSQSVQLKEEKCSDEPEAVQSKWGRGTETLTVPAQQKKHLSMLRLGVAK